MTAPTRFGHPHTCQPAAPWLRAGFLAAAGLHLAVLVGGLSGGLSGLVLSMLLVTAAALAALSWQLAGGFDRHRRGALRCLAVATTAGLLLRLATGTDLAVDAMLLALPALQLGLAVPLLLDRRALPWLAGTTLVAATLFVAAVVPVGAVQLGALTAALVGALALVVGLVHAVTEPMLHAS